VRGIEMVVIEPILLGMWVNNYITYTELPDDREVSRVVYGTFATVEEAEAWAKNLEGKTTIIPVYVPAFNRG
jgi:hypothetical protein